ncbi:MAG: extracellular solute-binding protein [Treponemataceae bacterium]|nr:MAG: extracellular solute-binding protein [Treponemataceae bacterium]
MKNRFICCAVSVALSALTFVSCGSPKKVLYLYNWTYYTPDTVIAQFEQEFGVDVIIDEYDSNEKMFAQLKAGASAYDIVVPSQDYVSIMIHENMLAKIDREKFTNADKINPAILAKAGYDSAMEYSVPYYVGAAGIAVNTAKVQSYEKSWDIFSRQDLRDHMSMLDDMREVIGDALKFSGNSVNTLDGEQLNEAKTRILTEWKPNLVKFDAEGYGKSFASQDFWVVQGYSEAVFGEIDAQDAKNVDFFIPVEGGPMYLDSLCILKNAKHYDEAMEFINFIHRPEIYAQFLDTFLFQPAVNPAAAEFMTTTPRYSSEDLERCELKNDLGRDLPLYEAIWQEIRY